MHVPGDQHAPQVFLANAHSLTHHKRVEEILSLNGVKFQLVLDVRFTNRRPKNSKSGMKQYPVAKGNSSYS